jgi:hypothetical protein
MNSNVRPLAGMFLSLLVLSLSIAGCGGGSETKTGSGGTGAPVAPTAEDITAAGPLTSLGPETIGAQVFEGGTPQIALNADGGRALSDLRLGMVAEVQGRSATAGAAAAGNTFNVQSIVAGPLLAIDLPGNRLHFPGAVAEIDANTIFDGVGALSTLTPGTQLEVHGLPRPAMGNFLATRIARSSQTGNAISLLGTISAVTSTGFTFSGLNATTATATLVGAPLITTSTAPPSLIVNAVVRVTGVYAPTTQSILATQVVGGLNAQRPESQTVALDGLVESIGAPNEFRVASTLVRAAALPATVQANTRVRVRGRMQGGVLIASSIAVQDAQTAIDYQVAGSISALPAAQTITVRGETIRTHAAVFVGGTAGDLAVGKRVQATLRVENGALSAREIRFQ